MKRSCDQVYVGSPEPAGGGRDKVREGRVALHEEADFGGIGSTGKGGK